ncbi:MAG: hypothetical protein V4629_11540 [Pseudomonadota bacterium]
MQTSAEEKISLDEKNLFFPRLNTDTRQRDATADQYWSGHAGSQRLLVDIKTSNGKTIKTLFCENINRFNTPHVADQPMILWWVFPIFLPSDLSNEIKKVNEVKKTERMRLLLQWSIARWGQPLEKNNQNWISPQPRGWLWKSTVSEVWIYGFALDVSTFEHTASGSHDMQALWHSCRSAWQQIQPWFENNE